MRHALIVLIAVIVVALCSAPASAGPTNWFKVVWVCTAGPGVAPICVPIVVQVGGGAGVVPGKMLPTPIPNKTRGK